MSVSPSPSVANKVLNNPEFIGIPVYTVMGGVWIELFSPPFDSLFKK